MRLGPVSLAGLLKELLSKQVPGFYPDDTPRGVLKSTFKVAYYPESRSLFALHFNHLEGKKA
jgi:hypothetical protein